MGFFKKIVKPIKKVTAPVRKVAKPVTKPIVKAEKKLRAAANKHGIYAKANANYNTTDGASVNVFATK